jgi:HK97 family phage prohead protease
MQTELNYSAMYTKALDANSRSVVAVLSSETVDGHGEIVDQASWKLARFLKNPVVLYMHSRFDVIGRAEDVQIVDGCLQARIVFATTTLAQEAFTLFKDGAMRAFSVGFRPGSLKFEEVNGRKVNRLLDCELMEVSAVSIPSNPDAVVKHKALGLIPTDFRGGKSHDNASDDFLAETYRRCSLTSEQRADEDVARILDHDFGTYNGPDAA